MKAVDFFDSFCEVPGEVSLVISISGCPFSCKGCHSSYLQDSSVGVELTPDLIKQHINPLHTCVCFFGGETFGGFPSILKWCKEIGLKTALYTGNTKVEKSILLLLDYVKLGPYSERLGGLDKHTTNQKFIRVRDWKDLTHLFQRDEND